MSVTLVLRRLQDLVRRVQMEDGQALVEYALLISLIAIVSFGVVNEFGLGVSSLYGKVNAVVP
ncbi:MAG TPA: hypothetical protein VGK68_07660 [Gaiellaceae bacterium]